MFKTIKLNRLFFFLLLYISLLLGFFLNENTLGGSIEDFIKRTNIIEDFKSNFLNTFLNYDNYSDRHTPTLLIILATLNKLGFSLDLIRLLHLNILPLIVISSYKCLKLKFPDINKHILFFISLVFFLSPTMRSLSIWPDSRIWGFLFFIISLYFFLKFQQKKKFIDCVYNNIFLVISSYFSPNFSIFFIYYFLSYLKFYKISTNIVWIIVLNVILSIPIFYYLIVLDVNFLTTHAIGSVDLFTRLNPSNKIFIISTLVFFYFIPFSLNKLCLDSIIKNFNKYSIFKILPFFIILAFFFNYSINFTGGGIFFKISYLLFNNQYLFFLITFLSITFILSVFKINYNNILIFIILILSNPQLTIYHKYYDPLLIILFFTLFNFNFDIKSIVNKLLVRNLYIFYLFFLGLNFLR